MLWYGRYPKLLRPAHHHQHLRRGFNKMLHVPQHDALEIRHFAADQVGTVEIPIISPRQFAAGHTNLGPPQSLRLIPILDSRQFDRQRAAAAAARLDTIDLPHAPPADAQTSMFEQSFWGIGVRT